MENSMDWDVLYNILNKEKLAETLQSYGRDLIVLDHTNAMRNIFENAALARKAVSYINANRNNASDKFTVIGASMGGRSGHTDRPRRYGQRSCDVRNQPCQHMDQFRLAAQRGEHSFRPAGVLCVLSRERFHTGKRGPFLLFGEPTCRQANVACPPFHNNHTCGQQFKRDISSDIGSERISHLLQENCDQQWFWIRIAAIFRGRRAHHSLGQSSGT